MSRAIEVRGLVKRYRVKKRQGLFKSSVEVVEALRGVSFTVDYGEVVGLLGPNGAGKTTTIKILATLLLPDEGEAYVAGYNVVKEPGEVRKRTGLMLTVERGFYGKLTGRENLEYFAALYGLDREYADKRIGHLMRLLELDRLGGDYKLFEEFSLGMRARLSLARALLSDAPVLLLDEPTLGLDPPSARRIRELVERLAREERKAVLYTTHNMFEAEIVCDRILLINRGQVVASGSPRELKDRLPRLKVLTLVLRGRSREKLQSAMRDLGLKYEVSEESDLYSIRVHVKKPEEVFSEVAKRLISSGFDLVSARVEEPTLEDVFIYFSEGSL
ncbi:MAG: ABC transporter ATP-binding protein [Desulfurococcaceae archaeon]